MLSPQRINPHGYLRLIGGRTVCDGHELLWVHSPGGAPPQPAWQGPPSLLQSKGEREVMGAAFPLPSSLSISACLCLSSSLHPFFSTHFTPFSSMLAANWLPPPPISQLPAPCRTWSSRRSPYTSPCACHTCAHTYIHTHPAYFFFYWHSCQRLHSHFLKIFFFHSHNTLRKTPICRNLTYNVQWLLNITQQNATWVFARPYIDGLSLCPQNFTHLSWTRWHFISLWDRRIHGWHIGIGFIQTFVRFFP